MVSGSGQWSEANSRYLRPNLFFLLVTINSFFYPVHFAPVFNTCMTLANRRFFVSSCFAPLMELAISFLGVKESFSHLSCAFLFLANSF